MKINMKLLSMFSLLLIVAGLTAVCATEANVGSSTFEVPEGFSVNATMGPMTMLMSDDSAIVIIETEEGDIEDISSAKDELIEKGYTFVDEDSYNVGDIEIKQQNYNKDGLNSCLYVFNKNDKSYVVTYTLDEEVDIPSNEDNPVTTIVNTVK